MHRSFKLTGVIELQLVISSPLIHALVNVPSEDILILAKGGTKNNYVYNKCMNIRSNISNRGGIAQLVSRLPPMLGIRIWILVGTWLGHRMNIWKGKRLLAVKVILHQLADWCIIILKKKNNIKMITNIVSTPEPSQYGKKQALLSTLQVMRLSIIDWRPCRAWMHDHELCISIFIPQNYSKSHTDVLLINQSD